MSTGVMRHRLGLDRNPMRRTSDRVEAVALWLALLGGLLAIPASVVAGIAADASSVRAAAVRAATARPVVAHTLTTSPVNPVATVAIDIRVDALWTDPDGIRRTGRIAVVPGTPVGAAVTIWLDGAGNQVAAPSSRTASALTGAASGVGFFVLAVLGLAGAFGVTRLVLERRRLRAWADDWDRVAGTWCRC